MCTKRDQKNLYIQQMKWDQIHSKRVRSKNDKNNNTRNNNWGSWVSFADHFNSHSTWFLSLFFSLLTIFLFSCHPLAHSIALHFSSGFSIFSISTRIIRLCPNKTVPVPFTSFQLFVVLLLFPLILVDRIRVETVFLCSLVLCVCWIYTWCPHKRTHLPKDRYFKRNVEQQTSCSRLHIVYIFWEKKRKGTFRLHACTPSLRLTVWILYSGILYMYNMYDLYVLDKQ